VGVEPGGEHEVLRGAGLAVSLGEQKGVGQTGGITLALCVVGLELLGILVLRILPVLLADGVVERDGGVEDGEGRVGKLLPIGVGGGGGLCCHQAFLRQGRGIVAGLGVAGLAALALLDEDRVKDGLEVVGIDLKEAAGGAQHVILIASTLIGVDHLIEDCGLGDALRVSLQECFARGGLGLGIGLGAEHLVRIKLGRILDRKILGLQHGRGKQTDARERHYRRKDKLLHSVLLGKFEMGIRLQHLRDTATEAVQPNALEEPGEDNNDATAPDAVMDGL
jgi:hypothetical protein